MSQHSKTRAYDECIVSRLGAHHSILELILEELKKQGWSKQDIFAIHMAMEEALTNAIRHGNAQDESKHVHLLAQVSPIRFWAEVHDEGPGFDHKTLPNPTTPENLCVPCGRGMLLIKNYMTEVHFNPKGNRMTLIKTPSEASDSKENTSKGKSNE